MVKMQNARKTLEVGAGPGKHSLMLASSFLKNGNTLVSTDFSNAMMSKLQENYGNPENDYS